jgi:hypothetical protein
MTTKVIVVIVEGNSDKTLISDRLEEYFDEYNVNFAVVGTDIFNRSKTTTILSNINKRIKKLKEVKKFDSKDILCVIHITDTDGCFIDDDFIVVDEDQGKLTVYTENNIVVNADIQKSNMMGRNHSKRDNTNVMNFKKFINFENITVNYQLYYFSRNLEHVVFDNPNPEKKAKVSEVNDFVNNLTVDLERWLHDYIPAMSNGDYSSKYTESWKYIAEKSNSLKRCTNVPLLFEYIDGEIRGE